jgi:tRNA(fMet)-specific endonuclease VapC
MLDTDVFSIAARGGSARLRARLDTIAPQDIALSVICLGEIEFGLSKQPAPAWLAQRISQLRQAFVPLPMQPAAALTYGKLRQILAKKGTPIGPNDLWIAAHAMHEGLTLVSNNEREFARVPGLKFENWLR